MDFRLLRPEEILARWDELSALLQKAVDKGRGELEVDDIRRLVLDGKMFVVGGFHNGNLDFATTAEFVVYPRKTVLHVGFGAGVVRNEFDAGLEFFKQFAAMGGATAIQTWCSEASMVRYHEHFLGAKPAYAVLEVEV